MKIAKASDSGIFSDGSQNPVRGLVPLGLCHPKQIVFVGMADEMGIERFAMAGDAVDRIQVRLEKVGPGPISAKTTKL